ncbi:MAG TPA: YcxB family protein [Vicinamibacterales bacterium]|nr:YcxB family protein [Vicinamibacterales bacterium]
MILLLVASVLVLVGAFVLWRAGNVRDALTTGFVWFFGLAGAGIGQQLSIGPKARRVFRQQRGLQRPYDVSWDELGVAIRGENGQSRFPWTDFHKMRELDDQFMLFLSDAVFLMIPGRAFPDDNLMRDFRRSATDRIPRG